MQNEPKYHSYLVRLWLLDTGTDTAHWGGELTHIQSGQKYSFQDIDQLFHYLNEQLKGEQEPKD
jgi:hypothetical protein